MGRPFAFRYPEPRINASTAGRVVIVKLDELLDRKPLVARRSIVAVRNAIADIIADVADAERIARVVPEPIVIAGRAALAVLSPTSARRALGFTVIVIPSVLMIRRASPAACSAALWRGRVGMRKRLGIEDVAGRTPQELANPGERFEAQPFLLYARAGYNWLQTQETLVHIPANTNDFDRKRTRGVLLWGVGAEFALTHDFALRTEFNQTNFRNGLKAARLQFGGVLRF